MKLTRAFYLVAAALLGIMTFPLSANVVTPGNTVSPDVFTVSSAPPLLGDLTGAVQLGGGTAGFYEELVLRDPLGITCSGCLDFAFQVSLNSGSQIVVTQLTLSRFFGYTTDVGYVTGSGDVAPVSVMRGSAGGGTFFNLTLPSGQSSEFLVVATNATTYDTAGNLGVVGTTNGRNLTAQITNLFEPAQVPEPSTALLGGLGLLCIALFRKLAS